MILRSLLKRLIFLTILSFSSLISHLPADWDDYYKGTIGIVDPRKTLLISESLFTSSGLAVDLGAGTGRDTLYLLRKGWNVIAMDAESQALEIISNRAENEGLTHLELMLTPFNEMVLPENIDLINASFSLPFCNPQDFPECWEKIDQSLAVGGRFSGQFFGDRDEWNTNQSTMTFMTEEQIFNLFRDHYEIEYLEIQEGLIPTSQSPRKIWHLVHIVAKKIKI